jgi:hypothetical protein
MTTATIVPARSRPAPDAAGASGQRHIPVHTLRGERRFWADRLLTVFKGKKLDGIEWSMKFSAAGLAGNRFLLGISRENWGELDFPALARELAIAPSLSARVQQDMERANALFFAYEPDEEGRDTYRIYLGSLPAPQALREHGVLPLGCGYKWYPALSQAAAVTAYRVRHLDSREAYAGYFQPCLERLSQPVLRQVAHHIVTRAGEVADPRQFMLLEAGETGTRRDSFGVTFHGAHLPLREWISDLLRLAGSLALPEGEVLGCLVPDEPRTVSSLAAGIGRDGHEFLTIYYD